MPYRKFKVQGRVSKILYQPGGQRIITYSHRGSLQVWDLETSTQVEGWEDKTRGVMIASLSPDGKTLLSVSCLIGDGAVKLWSIDTGKVTKTLALTGHEKADYMCWSPDGGRVVGICADHTFQVWDVKSGETILGPIKAKTADNGPSHRLPRAYYSPDGKMIATAGGCLEIWDGNTGELLKTFEGHFTDLAWTSNGKTLTTWGGRSLLELQMMKIDTATWAVLDVRKISVGYPANTSFIPTPDGRFFATESRVNQTMQLWNIETNQPIGTPLQHEDVVHLATFSADGKFLFTKCRDNHVYIWDVSAILKEAGVPCPAPEMKGAPRGSLTMHCERLIRAFVYPNPMGHMITPFLYHANAPSAAFTHSGAAQSHTGKLGTILDLGPTLSAGLGT